MGWWIFGSDGDSLLKIQQDETKGMMAAASAEQELMLSVIRGTAAAERQARDRRRLLNAQARTRTLVNQIDSMESGSDSSRTAHSPPPMPEN